MGCYDIVNEDIVNEDIVNRFLSNRPETIAVFGYGSSIIKQSGYNINDNPQIDLAIIVSDTREWIKKNLIMNPNDCAANGKLFFQHAPAFLYDLGADIFCIISINDKNRLYKIVIAGENYFTNDLLNWDSFFLAGRFQKPMLIVKSNAKVDSEIDINQYNALITALFLLGNNKYDVRNLYARLCGLSFAGDVRMLIAENPNKVRNIVDRGFESINQIYSRYDLFVTNSINGNVCFDEQFITGQLLNIPLNIVPPQNGYLYTKEELSKVKNSIIRQLNFKNRIASTSQAIKSIIINDPAKTIEYVSKKIKKHFNAK